MGDNHDEDQVFKAWLNLNKINSMARQLTFNEIPNHFTWDRTKKQFRPRKRGPPRGGVMYVSRKINNNRHLKRLAGMLRGPTCDEEVRTHGGIVYPTYEEACRAHGILEE